MKKSYQILIAISFLAATTALSSQSYGAELYYGAEESKPDNAKITPWGEIKLQYDDNVFLSKSDKKNDFIVTLTPGVTAYLPFSDNLLTFDYHADFNRFLDHTNQNGTNQYVYGGLDLNWRDISFNIYDEFSHVFERPSIEDVSRVKRDDNRAGITAKVQKDRLGIQLGYENFTRDYKDPAYRGFDRTEHIYSFMLTHQTFPKTDLLFEYDFAQIRYDESTLSDSDYNQVLVGAIGNLTNKTTATVKAGYQFRNYEQASQTDFNSPVIYGDIVHRFSGKDALKLSFYKTAYESTYLPNNYYEVGNISGVYDHYLTPKLLGFLTGLYQVHSYPKETTEDGVTQKRKDNYYSIGTGIRYYLQKWLTLTLQAEHIVRDSNFRVFSYDQNLITFTAKAVF